MVELFKSEDGMLTIEKKNGEDAASKTSLESNDLSMKDMIDTMFAYSSNAVGNQAGTCEICGNTTDSSEKHLCEKCWAINRDKIMKSVKQAVGEGKVELG